MNLRGKPVKLSVTVAGGDSKIIYSEKYIVPMVNASGCVRHICVRDRQNHKRHIHNR